MNDPTTLVIAAPADLETEVPTLLNWAKALKVASAFEFNQAADQLKGIKDMARRISEFFSPLKKSAEATKKAILAAERRLSMPLAEAEDLAKHAMLTYQRSEEEKRLAEQCRLQAIADEEARIEREKIEAVITKQREIEEKAKAKSVQAFRDAEMAVTEKDKKRLLAQAETATRKATLAEMRKIEKAEEMEAVIAPVVQIASNPKPEGIQIRKIWKAEVVDKRILFKFILDTARYELLTINEQTLAAYARSMREEANMPGVRFFEESILIASEK